MTEQTQGKGRPTPKRSDAQKRRGGPVAPPPTNRRDAAKQLRAKQAENRKQVRSGTRTGDDRAMLPRDQGPVRRVARDVIDARRSLGWLLLPVAALTLLSGLMQNVQLQAVTFAIWVATIAGVAVDMVLAGMQLRRVLKDTFPQEPKVGSHIRYGLLRTTVMRRFRVPRPQVRPGG